MKIILATNNAHKVDEIRAIFTGHELLSLKEAGIECDAEETGSTFEENALIKARAVCALAGLPALADDSGLCVDALDGAPGVWSARYAALNGEDDNNALLLKRMENVPEQERGARFEAVAALVFPDGREYTAGGRVEGRITTAPRGKLGFGYDPLFAVDGITMAEMSAEEKNLISHRKRALEALRSEVGL